MRTLSGEVSYYDPDPGHYVALPEAVVEIPTLGLRAVTDRWGNSLFAIFLRAPILSVWQAYI